MSDPLKRITAQLAQIEEARVDYTLKVYKQLEGSFMLTGSVPGLFMAGSDLVKLLAGVPAAVDLLRRLNGHETETEK